MSNSFKEEIAVQHIDLNQHHDTGRDEIEKSHNVENANGVQDHVPWTSQGFAQTGNHDAKGVYRGESRKDVDDFWGDEGIKRREGSFLSSRKLDIQTRSTRGKNRIKRMNRIENRRKRKTKRTMMNDE